MKTAAVILIAVPAVIIILIIANPGCAQPEPQPDGSPATAAALRKPSQTGSSPASSFPNPTANLRYNDSGRRR